MSAIAEVVPRNTPLGLRFWDAVTGSAVADGLSLTLLGARGAISPAIVVNPSGVFVISGLPGLAASESAPLADSAFWAAPPASGSFTVLVDDQSARFQPFSFTVTAPSRGVAQLPCPVYGLPAPLQSVPLFSAPARVLGPGLGIVRAELWDAASNAPAAYALLDVAAGASAPTRGVADDQGRVLVPIPYPPLSGGLASPPLPQALSAQTWPVTWTARYDGTAGVGAPAGHPDLCRVLGQPAAAAAASSSPSPASAALAYGAELVLSTPGRTVLLVNPGAPS